ncbi:hypothetical protein NM688_g7086 [Phlebia brevispora]|uniref:Uncharacterized protein n=1 Tax=Phlebia brevispora TaxID=194682 RepID=A0ACC1S991_9APHY|nr:hypothetical protein NM688_g7086 [Phlebia brevispora]
MISTITLGLAIAAFAKSAAGHASIWHQSMWGFNVTAQTFSYDNRPVVPLQQMPFNQWWFHNHLAYPPHPDDFMEFPAGGSVNMQISCDKGYTDLYASAPGGDIRDPNSPLACPGQPTTAIHANNIEDVAGCAIGIAYKSDVNDVQPQDFAIFTVNYTCPWYLNTEFQIPADMPACPEGGCICGWFWIHNPDSGSEQMYMNGFQCKITGQTGNTPIGTPGLARRCGADPANGKPDASPNNCTVGPVQPFYWDQQEGNNVGMFEGIYSPPLYNGLYGFVDGAQPNLFQEPTVGGAPAAVPASSSAPAQSPSPSAQSVPVVASSSADTAAGSVAVSASVNVPQPATTSASAIAASAPKCKRRLPGEKKQKKRKSKARRSSIERHLKKRLAHESH